MKAELKNVIAIAVACYCLTAMSGVVNDATQTRASSSERVPLVALVMPALQQIGADNVVAAGCFALLSNPTLKINHSIEIRKDGQSMSAELNDVLAENKGKIYGCTAAISAHADELSKTLRQMRPDRITALKIIKEAYSKRIASDYANWQDANQDAFGGPVLIAKDNNGHSKEYMAFNDVNWQKERAKTNVSGGGGWGNGSSSIDDVGIKVNVDAGENSAKEKGGIIREIITDGVYSFFTNSETINSVCVVPGAKSQNCKETYSMKFDGTSIDVRKNGQRWFDSEFIGGAVYAIEMSGEKSTGTTKKMER